MRIAPELLIMLGCAMVLALIASCTAGCGSVEEQKRRATAAAHAWATELGMDVKGVSCSGMDSDMDGYTSCTVLTRDERVQAVECGTTWNRNCRVPKPLAGQ